MVLVGSVEWCHEIRGCDGGCTRIAASIVCTNTSGTVVGVHADLCHLHTFLTLGTLI